MWQTDWAERIHGDEVHVGKETSLLKVKDVDAVCFLQWKERCLECAQPACYKVCPLYVQRRDQRCARFKNGIFPNPHYSGLYPFGAEIRFRRWGALESAFGGGAMTPADARWFDRVDRLMLAWLTPVSTAIRRISPKYRLNRAYGVLRERWLRAHTRPAKAAYDDFVVEVWNLDATAVRLIIECHQGGPVFRSSVLAEPGRSLHSIPLASMGIDLDGKAGNVRVYPENDVEAHVVFTWLDFVRRSAASRKVPVDAGTKRSAAGEPAKSAAAVKCVIWDLDNTVWEGILGEQDPNQVVLRPGVRETMLELDARGILQSVASKNDYEEAWRVLGRLGIAPLMLYPRINWQPKSANIREIVNELNIGADACAFIDDSPFERAEVASSVPEIRTFAETDILELLEMPEFSVEVTEESRQRRQYYVAESGRKELARGFGENYEEFLRTCKMEAKLFSPDDPSQVQRSRELLNRTNQLNLTAYRYRPEELDALLADPDAMCICTACRDRFGDYGTVGFASLKPSGDRLFLVDFVLSCRVAQKKVENAWFGWLTGYAKSAGYSKVYARYRKTARNHVLLNAFLDSGFTETEKYTDGSLLELDCDVMPPMSTLVAIAADAVPHLRQETASASSGGIG